MSKANSNTMVDEAILKLLPPGAIVTNVAPWATSGWTETQRITTINPDDESAEYFLKSSNNEGAATMFEGEFLGLQKLHELMPDACPKPYGWGEYVAQPGTYFVMMEFLYLIAKEPSAPAIAQLIAKMHRATAGTSPDKQNGFYIPTCHGKVLQPNDWDPDWARFFGRLLNVIYDADIALNGPFPEYDAAFALLQAKVVPRLLGALTADGRQLVPVLLHGDLTQYNMGINEETDEPMIYDPGMFYGHNEFELGMWRTSFVSFDESYRKQYALCMPPSEPTAEWDDRNLLYSLFFHISHSAHWLATAASTRLITLNGMNYLNNKYAGQEIPAAWPKVSQPIPQSFESKITATVHSEAVAAVM